jgi:hypothetical protein
VKLHGHPCWRVQSALDQQRIEYEVAKGPFLRQNRRGLEQISGQRAYPVIEFEDSSVYREESKDTAATIRAGKVDEKRTG